MRTSITFCAFFIILIAIGCKKEENDPEISNSLSSISSSVFLATADVHEKGVYEITDHGFIVIFSSERPTYSGGQTISLGNIIEHDTFCSIIDVNKYQISYYDNLKCYVRAYITNKRGTVYSDFAWKAVPKVQVYSIYPSSARSGDTVSISGQNFDPDITKNSVKFNSIASSVIAVTNNRIDVIVPANIYLDYWTPYINVEVKSAGQEFSLYNALTLLPSVTGFMPSSGSWNTMITINGTGLQSSYVKIDDQQITYYNRTSSSISFSIPYDCPKKFKIYVTNGNERIEVPGGYFTMDDMMIDPLTVLDYYPGGSITINGSGFNPTSSFNKLILGQNIIEASYGSNDYMIFNLPYNLAAGSYVPVIRNGVDTVHLSQNIRIIKPEITGISADSAFSGSIITITGTNLLYGSSYYPNIYFGNYGVYPNSGDDDQLSLQVPYVMPGSYNIRANYSGMDVFYDGYIIVKEPRIISIAPSTGSAEMSVIIEGEGFGDVSSTAVYFGNIQAQILSMNRTRINVKVPSQVTSGSWLVQVYINNYKLSTNVTFTVP